MRSTNVRASMTSSAARRLSCILCATVLLTVFALLPTLACAQFRYTIQAVPRGNTTLPSPRSDHLTVVVTTKIGFFLIVHGGRDARGGKADTWYYVVEKNEWSLLVPESPLVENDPPPAMFGTVGGYRFVRGYKAPFLYVTLGTGDGETQFYNEMWAMNFDTNTWKKVTLHGEIPGPRYGAAGALVRFAKSDGTVQPALIVTHGQGRDGALSDSFKCTFNATDPYQATWRRMHAPISMYSTKRPHPMWMQGSAFTAKRDLALFGGCYASKNTGGLCPSQDTWLLRYTPERLKNETAESSSPDPTMVEGAIPTSNFVPETDSVSWARIPRGPAPRIGPAMAQGLNSFENAYENYDGVAVMYSGTQNPIGLPAQQVLSAPTVDGREVALLSTKAEAWTREKVDYVGAPEMEHDTVAARRAPTLSMVRNTSNSDRQDVSNEFYLLFGGQLDDGTYTNALLQLSFDGVAASTIISGKVMWKSRPLVHGILMFTSWGVLMVIGAFAARYLRGKTSNSRALVIHASAQAIALVVAWVGVGMGIYSRRDRPAWFLHANLGFLAIALASIQPLVAIAGICLRRHFVTEISGRSQGGAWFYKLYHRVVGILVMCLGFVNITLGLFLIVAPLILWVHWLVYSVLLSLVAFWLEVIGGNRNKAQNLGRNRSSAMDPASQAQQPPTEDLTATHPRRSSLLRLGQLRRLFSAQQQGQNNISYDSGGAATAPNSTERMLRPRDDSAVSSQMTFIDPDSY